MSAIIKLSIVCDSEDLVGDVTKMAVDLASDLRLLHGVDAVFVTGIHTELESQRMPEEPGDNQPVVFINDSAQHIADAPPPVETVRLHDVTPTTKEDEDAR